MKSKFLSVVLAIAATFTFSAFAQTGSAATPSSAAAPISAPASTAPAAAPVPTGPGKVGTINIQDAIIASNEGRRDMDALQKKYEPKQAELKNQNDELESLKKQLTTQQDKLNPEALDTLKTSDRRQAEELRPQRAGCAGRSWQSATGDCGPDSFQDGAAHREIRAGKRIHDDHRYVQAVAPEPGAVVEP